MCWFRYFLLHFCFLGSPYSTSQAWDVKMPSNIEALLGSCLVIPCSFDYYWYPPKRADRVVWYQYVDRGYPLVYDKWYPGDVISMYRGRTDVVKGYRTCTLIIDYVNWNDHRQRLYPWVDPENVGSRTYKFYETSVKIEVVSQPNAPRITITGERKVGRSVTVECSAVHTCSDHPPTLRFNVRLTNKDTSHDEQSDGTSRTTVRATLVLERDQQVVECTVEHQGGRKATSSETVNAQCSFLPLTITQTSSEFLEGSASKVTCTATYTCSKDVPTLTWNYASMPATSNTYRAYDGIMWKTVSTLTFTPSANDHGSYLICYARYNGNQIQGSISLRVKRNMLNRDWSFTSPKSLTGMKGSCLVIPCKFTYSKSQPNGLQVIWYLYQGSGRTPVFNQEQRNILSRYNGKTSLTGSVTENNCSLKIDRLEMSHSKDQLYPWVDKNPITSYHTDGYSFLDKSTQIMVSDHAQEPQMSINEVPRVGDKSTVACKVQHTCFSSPPLLSLEGPSGTDRFIDLLVSDGIWERRIERTWDVEEDHKSMKCTVKYMGGQSAKSELVLRVECPYDEIKMIEPPGEITEGVAKSVICSVSYKCKRNIPIIEWNFPDMHHVLKHKKISENTYTIESNLTFIGSMEDNEKLLNCTAQFAGGKTSNSSVLKITEYVEPIEELNEKDTYRVQVADVPFRFNALSRSCVVIPCSFKDDEDHPLTRGIWYKKTGGMVYHNSRAMVLNHFKDRTRILGNLNENECSLEIDDVKPFDNGPFCFYGEKGENKYRYNHSCVFLVMKASPDKPVMSSVPTEVNAGSTVTVSCSVSHTCSSHPPEFSWSVPSVNNEVSDTSLSRGVWKRTSTITFVVPGGDGLKNLTCIATFWPKHKYARTFTLIVQGTLKYQMGRYAPAVVPITLLVLILLAVVIGMFFYWKKKHANDPVRPPTRPEKSGSLWDRLTRLYSQGHREKPPRPEKRRSIWSRFSRRQEEDQVEWQNARKSFWNRFSRRQNNLADPSFGYLSHTEMVICDKPVSKQRYPSPKSKQRRPAPPTPEDGNLYGNI